MFRISMVVGVFSFLGSLTGILVEISIAAKLGLSKNSDTFYVAFTLPYIITNLISATGQFSLVPFFSSLDTHPGRENLWRGFSYAVNVILLGLAAVAALGAITAPWLIRGIAPGFPHSEALFASELCRWLFLILLPAGVAETIRSFLLSQHRFAIPASGNFFRNVTVIASILLTFHRYGFYSIVLGYLVGYLIQLVILAAQLLIIFPVRYSFTLAGSGEAFRNLRGAGAAQVGTALGWQGVVVVERIIASFLPPGTLTALAYGLKIMTTLAEVLAGSVGTAALPTLSKAFARKATEEERGAFRNTLEISLILVMPAMIFCLMLAHNIIQLVFERGSFTPEATALMSRVFFYYSLALLPYGAVRLLNFYLFARRQAELYLRLALFQYALNIAFDLLFVGVLRLGAVGIPLGFLTSLVIIGGIAYRRNVGDLWRVLDRSLRAFAYKILAGSGLVALLVWGLRSWMAAPRGGMANFVYLCELCGAGLLVFLGSLAVSGAVPLSQWASLWHAPEEI